MADLTKEDWVKIKDAQGTMSIATKEGYAVCMFSQAFVPTKGYIYEKDWGKESIETREHIANLFMASPDMYEALRECLALLDKQREEYNAILTPLPHTPYEEGPIAKKARAAVAKAEGKNE